MKETCYIIDLLPPWSARPTRGRHPTGHDEETDEEALSNGAQKLVVAAVTIFRAPRFWNAMANSFDYIIVGAGSAGCALAATLAANCNNSVLLLEAGGGNQSPFVSMPRGYVALWTAPKYYWRFPVKAQPDRPPNEEWYYGKGLGGSSSLNGMWYFRGQPDDYDRWEAEGNIGWNWRTIEGEFLKLENYAGEHGNVARGNSGPVTVTTLSCRSRLTEDVIAAGMEFGLEAVADVNTPRTPCIGYTQMTVDRRGRRVSSFDAFLKSRRPKNLEIKLHVLVERLLFEGKRAIGVACRVGASKTEFFARREVILCAGVLQSPKLLQLSGVGDPDHLAQYQIPVVHGNRNVGQHLAEHMLLAIPYRISGAHGMNREFRSWRLWKNVLGFYLTGSGPMAYGAPEVSAMLASKGNPVWPDIQLGISLATFEQAEEGNSAPGRGRTERLPGLSMVGFQLRPYSRGSVRIQSASIEDPVAVDANWLGDERDVAAAVNLVRTIRKFIQQPSIQKYAPQEMGPSQGAHSEAEIRHVATNLLRSGLHGTGTCRMGTSETGVVDARLRVHGLSGVRVVDCSIMPTPISGNTNGPAMAVALRAADLIVQDQAS